VEVHRGSENGPLVGSGYFPKFSRRIEISLDAGTGRIERFDMTRPEMFDRTRVFELWGRKYAFKATRQGSTHLMKRDLKLVDLGEPNQPLMIFRKSSGLTKWGRFEFQRPGLSQAQVDAIVVCTLAVLEKLRREQNNSSGTAGAGGGGSC
jgi:hypothetical protein